MNKTELNRIVRTWQKRLPLDAWEIVVDWDTPADEGNSAQVRLPINYHYAVINVAPEFTDWESRKTNRVMLHELMHVCIRDLDYVADAAAKQLGSQAYDVSRAAWNHAEEGFVEQMAQRLVDTWGLA